MADRVEPLDLDLIEQRAASRWRGGLLFGADAAVNDAAALLAEVRRLREQRDRVAEALTTTAEGRGYYGYELEAFNDGCSAIRAAVRSALEGTEK